MLKTTQWLPTSLKSKKSSWNERHYTIPLLLLWPRLYHPPPLTQLQPQGPLSWLSNSCYLWARSVLLPRMLIPHKAECWASSNVTFSRKLSLSTPFKITAPLLESPHHPYLLYIFPRNYHNFYFIYFIGFSYYVSFTGILLSGGEGTLLFTSVPRAMNEWINEWSNSIFMQ